MVLASYIDDATKIVKHKFGSRLAKNDDLIANVATELINADKNFNGTGSKEGYRYSRGVFIARHYIRVQKRVKKQKKLDIDLFLSSYHTKSHIDRRIKDKLTIKDILTDIDVLPGRQPDAMRLYFLEGFTLREIGNVLEVSHEQIRLDINAGIKTLKEKYGLANQN